MAQRTSKKAKSKPTKKGTSRQKKYLWQLFIAFAVILAIILITVKPGEKDPVGKSRQAGRSAPQFSKEGSLTFYNKFGDSITSVDIEIADNDAERAMGLMYRKSMKESQAMLFIMEREEPQSFWMKNTYISLDIIFLNKDLEIVTIQKYTQPLSNESVPSYKKAKYVLEVIAGFTDRFAISEEGSVKYNRKIVASGI